MTNQQNPQNPASTWQASRIEQMLSATKRLPADQQRLFSALYVQGLAEDEACEELDISNEIFNARKQNMLRSLKAAAA